MALSLLENDSIIKWKTKYTTLSEHFQNPIEKSQKETKSKSLKHKYMNARFHCFTFLKHLYSVSLFRADRGSKSFVVCVVFCWPLFIYIYFFYFFYFFFLFSIVLYVLHSKLLVASLLSSSFSSIFDSTSITPRQNARHSQGTKFRNIEALRLKVIC